MFKFIGRVMGVKGAEFLGLGPKVTFFATVLASGSLLVALFAGFSLAKVKGMDDAVTEVLETQALPAVELEASMQE